MKSLRPFALLACALSAFAILLCPSLAVAAPAWTIETAPAWVVAVELAAPGAAPGSSEAANGTRHLLYDHQVRVRGPLVEAYSRISRQITNEAGLTATSQVSIEFDPTFETLAIHSIVVRRGPEKWDRLTPDSIKIVQRERNLEAQVFDGRQSAVSFVSDLRVGDVVEYSFTLRSSDPTAQDHFGTALPMGATEPIARLHTRVLVQDRRKLRLRVHAPDGDRSPYGVEPVETPDGVSYEWDFRDVRAYVADPFVPTWYSSIPWVQASDFDSWEEVAAWGANLFDVQSRADERLRAWVEDARHEATSDDAFLLRAIRFVQDEVRYLGIEVGVSRRHPTAPSTVFDRRYGDCKDKAMLLVAILRLGGIEAAPALVSTVLRETLDEWTPTDLAFNHAIVRIAPRGGGVLWVDATMALQGGGLDRFQHSQYERALTLAKRGGRLEALPRPPADRPSPSVHDHYDVPLPGSATEARLDSERTYEGDVADSMRNQLRGKTSEEIGKFFLSLYQSDFSTIREAAPVEQHDDRERNSLRVVVHLAIPHFWTLAPGAGRYTVNIASNVTAIALNRPPSAQRAAPLALSFPLRIRHEIDIDLPFDLPMTPENLVIGDDAFELSFQAAYTRPRLSYRFEVATRAPSVSAARLPEHLDQIDKARLVVVRTLFYDAAVAAGGFNWTALVVLLGCVPLVCWGVYRAYRYEPRRRPPTPDVSADPRLAGIKGWLVLLAVSIALNPVFSLVGLIATWRVAFSLATWTALTTPGSPSYSPALAIGTIVEAVALSALTAYSVAVAVLFFQQRRSFRLHFTVFALATVAFGIAGAVVAGAVRTEPLSAPTIGAVLRAVVYASIWVTYIWRSERAAATFVNRAPRRRRARSRRPARVASAGTPSEE
ncbi:MAG: DUF3857 domain-containing protein [Labilithrix sp.]|nr:DUF3857 domain-containing protein [Labilithrix sp.]